MRTPPAAFTWTPRRAVLAHQRQILERGTGGGEARRGLDEAGTRGGAQLAGADLLLVVQVRVLEDHLHRPALRGLDDGPDVALDVRVLTGDQAADVQHHVDLVRPGA